MHYRPLGRTGLKVSVIGIGTWQYGGEWGEPFSQAAVDAILDAAAEQGVNLIDTAECYGDHLAERRIGDYLARRRRSDWVVASKFGHHFHGPFQRSQHWQPREVLGQLEASLRALRSERIELYQFHSGADSVFFNDELWQLLRDQQQAGKIGHLGVSVDKNGNPAQVQAAAGVGAAALQVVYNRLQRGAEQHALPQAQADGLGVLARVPLASGYLSGKYAPGATFGDHDVRHQHDAASVQGWLREAQQVARDEVPKGVPIAQWALAWCLRNPAVASVIPGCKSPQQARQNASAAHLLDAHGQWRVSQ
ncbi:aldo/keto reductase [Pseudomonas sp. NPDC007930]|uniref:aldo/keto reductase n=1 Tax=Pseudomonas sp. NPDC007930 TaxID=3364417 RepID=UPI0036F0BE05